MKAEKPKFSPKSGPFRPIRSLFWPFCEKVLPIFLGYFATLTFHIFIFLLEFTLIRGYWARHYWTTPHCKEVKVAELQLPFPFYSTGFSDVIADDNELVAFFHNLDPIPIDRVIRSYALPLLNSGTVNTDRSLREHGYIQD